MYKKKILVDGHWSDWMRWSPCSSTCGSGMKTRARMCTNPAPSQGGKDCVGSPYEMQQCFEIICPGQYHMYIFQVLLLLDLLILGDIL